MQTKSVVILTSVARVPNDLPATFVLTWIIKQFVTGGTHKIEGDRVIVVALQISSVQK